MNPSQVARVDLGSLVELHLGVSPDPAAEGFEDQALSMYDRLREALRGQGASQRDVVYERVFLTDVAAQAPLLGALRARAFAPQGAGASRPATSRVQQPPAEPGRLCELLAVALVPAAGGSVSTRAIEGLPAGASGCVVDSGDLRQVFFAGLTGGAPGDGLDVPGQASAMFDAAGAALAHAGLSFGDVVRTWICLPEIDRDYAALNGARRRYFRGAAIDQPPASTGIGGVPFPPDRACGLDLRAIHGGGDVGVTRLSTGRMNEAPSYGSDFARGTRVDHSGRSILYISGTASIDHEGQVAHPGDLEAQADRALSNIESLLAGQDSGWDDVVSATTYLRRRDFAPAFRRVAERHGLGGRGPHVVCVADICRPEWLCEIEVTAVVSGALEQADKPR